MVSGTDEYLSLVKVKDSLGNGRGFTLPKRDDTISRVTLLYICSYKAGRHLPKGVVQAPKYV